MLMALLPWFNVYWLNIHTPKQTDNSDHISTIYIPITFNYEHILISSENTTCMLHIMFLTIVSSLGITPFDNCSLGFTPFVKNYIFWKLKSITSQVVNLPMEASL